MDSNSVLAKKYTNVLKAYEYHSKYFNKYYNENRFYFIASFQDSISGSLKKSNSGGKGLTELLNSLQEQSEDFECYILSGNDLLLLNKKYLSTNCDGYIGFNDQNDFISHIPKLDLFQSKTIFFPGVAYNLSFAIKKGG